MKEFLPHQTKAFNYAYGKRSIALFMEMRLGKTLVTIRWVNALPPLFPKKSNVLVVAPLTVLPPWQDELLDEGVNPSKIVLLLGSPKTRLKLAKSSNSSWLLVNYEGLRACPDLLDLPWKAVILDESTRIRNPKAQITKLCTRRFDNAFSKAVLSGLPAPESPLDYCEQFRFLHGHFMGIRNYWFLRDKYFNQLGYEWWPRSGTIQVFKQYVHSNAFVLTRKEAGIGPRKVYEKRYLALNASQRKAIREVEKDFSYKTPTSVLLTKWVPVQFAWLARIAGGFSPNGEVLSEEKRKEIYELLTGELKNEKVVIWFRFNDELLTINSFLKSKGIKSAAILGSTPLDVRRQRIHALKGKHLRVLCVQLKCGKYGLDMSSASTAIYYSNSYDMEDRAQSEDRIVHPLKKEPVLYIDLITKDSIDEDVVETLRDKRIVSRLFMTKVLENWKRRHHV